tara:strand:+ start:479 stop:874 length:396 start_codon:yes stop_codon:yes gene_type:complete
MVANELFDGANQALNNVVETLSTSDAAMAIDSSEVVKIGAYVAMGTCLAAATVLGLRVAYRKHRARKAVSGIKNLLDKGLDFDKAIEMAWRCKHVRFNCNNKKSNLRNSLQKYDPHYESLYTLKTHHNGYF